ncbi:MAG TPA: hypothetical protein VNU46_02995 [Gemmatimonadaceae bacterium]|jgi:hypothetical protein|nr:hypothetical protein [Gemmatimonadaceae bacterium]
MLGNLLREFQLLVALKLLFGAVVFSVFWARTRFWLPTYAHVLAAIGLIVGVYCVWDIPSDAPLSQHGPVPRFLFALIFPAMVYFFFVAYGGQRAAYRSKPKTAREIADLNEYLIYPVVYRSTLAEEAAWLPVVALLLVIVLLKAGDPIFFLIAVVVAVSVMYFGSKFLGVETVIYADRIESNSFSCKLTLQRSEVVGYRRHVEYSVTRDSIIVIDFFPIHDQFKKLQVRYVRSNPKKEPPELEKALATWMTGLKDLGGPILAHL